MQHTIHTARKNPTESTTTKRNHGLTRNEANFTILTLISFCIYMLGNSIDSISTFLEYISHIEIYSRLGWISTVNNLVFFLSHSIKVFVYFKFNDNFRRVLLQILTQTFGLFKSILFNWSLSLHGRFEMQKLIIIRFSF